MITQPPLDAREQRLDLSIEDDLVWFFTEAAGDMGLHGTTGAVIGMIERGLGVGSAAHDCEPDGRAMQAVARARRIDQALAAAGQLVNVPVADLARLHFGERRRFGPELPNLAEIVPEASAAHRRFHSRRPLRAWLERLGSKLERGTAERPDLDVGAELLRKSNSLLVEVGDAYLHARQKVFRARRAA